MPPSSSKKTKRTPSKSKASPKKAIPYSGPEHPVLDDKGRIRQWSSNSQDGRDLKIYVEYGCDESLTPTMMKEKFVQFKKYNPSTFSSALQNCRRAMNTQIQNRRHVNCKSIIFFKQSFSFFLYYKPHDSYL